MRILWHMPTLDPVACGLSRRALNLAGESTSRGHSVTFAAAADRTPITVDSIAGFPLQRLDIPRRSPPHWSLQALWRRRCAAQIVDTLAFNPQSAIRDPQLSHDLFISCQPEVIAEYATRPDRRPVVFVCGGTTLLHEALDSAERRTKPFWRRGGYVLDSTLKRANERAAFRRADKVIVDSNSTRQRVVDRYALDADRVWAVPGGIAPDLFHPPTVQDRSAVRAELGFTDHDCVIVWTGRLSREKNLQLLVRALAAGRLASHLLIVGDGPERPAVEKLIQRLDLNHRVRLLGAKNDVRPFLHAADLFAFPSLAESFGLSLVEAMACGLPCIAIRPDGVNVRTANDEIIENGRTGLLVEAADPIPFAGVIDELLSNSKRRRQIGTAASEHVKAVYSWQSTGDQFWAIIESLADSASRRIPHSEFRIPHSINPQSEIPNPQFV